MEKNTPKLIGLLVCLFLIVLAYFYFKQSAVDTTVPSPVAENKPAEEKVEPVISPASLEEPSPLAAQDPESTPEPDVVHFDVIEGFAVAFGDVILGVPEEDLKEGFHKIKIPDYWDKPEIPYAIDATLPNPARVKEALQHITKKTGVNFVPYDRQKDAIVFQPGKEHCLSALGRKGGLQPVKISNNCGWHEVVHETLHSLGFIHEQSRSDRDEFIDVLWDNIEVAFRPQFDKLPEEFLGPSKNSPFDYESVMLYSPEMFAKNKGEKTLKSRTPSSISPSQTGLSSQDALRIKKQFNLD